MKSKSNQMQSKKNKTLATLKSHSTRISRNNKLKNKSRSVSLKKHILLENNSTYLLQEPTQKNANKILKLVFYSEPKLVLLSELEITKLLVSFTPNYISKFTIAGILHNGMLLKKTYQNERIFKHCVAMYSIFYGKSLNTTEIAYIKSELKYLFDNNDDRIQEIKGGFISGTRIFSLFAYTLVLFDILAFYICHKSFVERLDHVGNGIVRLSKKLDDSLKITSNWTIDEYHRNIYDKRDFLML